MGKCVYIYTKISVGVLGALGALGASCHCAMQKHCYLPHRRHFGARNGRSGMLCSHSCAQRSRSGLLCGHSSAPKGHLGVLHGHNGAPKWHLWPFHGHSGSRNGCSGLLCGHSGAQSGCSGLLCCCSDAQNDVQSHIQGSCSKKLCSVTLDSVAQHSALLCSVHGYIIYTNVSV